jgi:hypothetical protein
MRIIPSIAIVAVAAFGLQAPPVAQADPHDSVAHAVNTLEAQICGMRMDFHQWPDVVDSLTGKGHIEGHHVETGLDETTALALIKGSMQTLCPPT